MQSGSAKGDNATQSSVVQEATQTTAPWDPAGLTAKPDKST